MLLGVGLAALAAVIWLVRRPVGTPPIRDAILRLEWAIPADSPVRYRLDVRVDGGVALADQAVQGDPAAAGVLRVSHDLPVAPGTHSISVAMTRVDSAVAPPGPRRADLPATLEYSGLVTFSPGEVVLVTYEPQARRLMAHRSSGR